MNGILFTCTSEDFKVEVGALVDESHGHLVGHVGAAIPVDGQHGITLLQTGICSLAALSELGNNQGIAITPVEAESPRATPGH